MVLLESVARKYNCSFQRAQRSLLNVSVTARIKPNIPQKAQKKPGYIPSYKTLTKNSLSSPQVTAPFKCVLQIGESLSAVLTDPFQTLAL